jgi:hypothetical protein
MENYLILRGVIMAAALVSIFAISIATLLIIIKRAQYFSGRTCTLVAISLSILLLVALSNFLIGHRDDDPNVISKIRVKTPGHSQLPGVALGVAAAVLLSQVLVLVNKTPQEENSDVITKKTLSNANNHKNTTVKSKPGRPKKKDKHTEKSTKDMTKTAGSPSRTENEKTSAKL